MVRDKILAFAIFVYIKYIGGKIIGCKETRWKKSKIQQRKD